MKIQNLFYVFLKHGSRFFIICPLGFVIFLSPLLSHDPALSQALYPQAPDNTYKAVYPTKEVGGDTIAVMPDIGLIRMDIDTNVEMNKSFYLDLWLQPSSSDFSESVEVFMEQTDKMLYEPRIFTLKPGVRKTVQAQVIKSNSGLARVIASANDWKTLDVTVNAGFSAKLKADYLAQPIESGSKRSFSLDLVDSHGKPIPLDAPVMLALRASKAKIRWEEAESWSEKIEFEISRGASSTPVIEIQPESWSMDTGMLQAKVRINNDLVVLDQTIQFTILPRWWLPLLMAIIGGILHGFYQVSKEITIPKGYLQWILSIIKSIASGASAGALSYFLANWDILGFKVDTTSLRGFVILGFLFSYVGIDLILKTVMPSKK